MIKVEGLTKRYARNVAVDHISFEVEKGQIVGFLGPNGAGKTTTMRMLTCFMPPTEALRPFTAITLTIPIPSRMCPPFDACAES